MVIVLVIEIFLKLIGFGLDVGGKFGKNITGLEKALRGFASQHDIDIKKDVKLKRRYDERLDDLRRAEDTERK
jgi:hypothetical protein